MACCMIMTYSRQLPLDSRVSLLPLDTYILLMRYNNSVAEQAD